MAIRGFAVVSCQHVTSINESKLELRTTHLSSGPIRQNKGRKRELSGKGGVIGLQSLPN